MQLYELLFIIVPSVTDAEIDKAITGVVGELKKEASELTVKEQKALGRRKFTYPIKHLTEGTYVLIDFEAETEHIQAINRALELNESVLRHMIVKKQIKSAEQIAKEEKLKLEMQQSRLKDDKTKDNAPQKKLVQKSEELPAKKEETPEEAEKSAEQLDEKLDEILKKEIT